MIAIELQDIGKSYGARHVLGRIHLSIEEGEFVSILGSSASGKTTLLKIAAGLVTPDRGMVRLDGQPVTGFPREASIVFQNYSLLPWLSAVENVRLAVEAAFPAWDRQRHTAQAKKYLEMVGLGSALSKRPSQLSGGMRQRVAIARAFAVEPRVIFLDEPFGALDALTRATLQQELARLCSEAARPVTALMITNSVDEAILLSDRIHALERGPGAGLSAAAAVSLPRPRTSDLLLHDERTVAVRLQLAELMVFARHTAPVAAEVRRVGLADSVPVET